MSFHIDDYLDEKGLLLNKWGQDQQDQLVCDCPQCGRRKLYVLSVDKANMEGVKIRAGAWKCFYCDSGGTVYSLVALVEGVSIAQARRIVARKRGSIGERNSLTEGRPEARER